MTLGALFRGKWLLGHLGVLVIAVGMCSLGLWQLDRLDERKEQNRSVEAAMNTEPLAVGSVAEVDSLGEFQRVRLTGTAVTTSNVLLRYPLRDGVRGYEVLTPIEVAPGQHVVVDRGWIPEADRPMRLFTSEKSRTVSLVGWVRKPMQSDPNLLAMEFADASAPTVKSVRPADNPDFFGGAQVASQWIQLEGATDPALADIDPLPLVLPAPTLDEGPHFSYALQWFSFAAIGLIGWAVVLRRAAKGKDVTEA